LQIEDSNAMFEHFRQNIGRGKGWFGWASGDSVEQELQKLRYLLACLEESARITGLKLMIGEVRQQKGSLSELVSGLRQWKSEQMKRETTDDVPPVFAYAF
jgi:hypothetical protein